MNEKNKTKALLKNKQFLEADVISEIQLRSIDFDFAERSPIGSYAPYNVITPESHVALIKIEFIADDPKLISYLSQNGFKVYIGIKNE